MFLSEHKILAKELKMILTFALFFVLLGFNTKDIFAQEYHLVWADEFNGTKLDSTKWSYQIGNRHGWGNHEKEYYTSENAIVKDEIGNTGSLKCGQSCQSAKVCGLPSG
ncbi:MAG: hypothetical protein P8Z35_25475 [Ignavibacteriaceae bacterium]